MCTAHDGRLMGKILGSVEISHINNASNSGTVELLVVWIKLYNVF